MKSPNYFLVNNKGNVAPLGSSQQNIIVNLDLGHLKLSDISHKNPPESVVALAKKHTLPEIYVKPVLETELERILKEFK